MNKIQSANETNQRLEKLIEENVFNCLLSVIATSDSYEKLNRNWTLMCTNFSLNLDPSANSNPKSTDLTKNSYIFVKDFNDEILGYELTSKEFQEFLNGNIILEKDIRNLGDYRTRQLVDLYYNTTFMPYDS